MSTKKERESTENLEKCCKIVQQSCAKGINAVDIAEKMNMDKSTVYGYLNSLMYMGRVEDRHGLWYAKEEEPKTEPSEKEITIELPAQQKDIPRLALIEAYAQDWEEKFKRTDNGYRILLEKYEEARTIRIKGKNVDDLDLEKIGNLIQQANSESSKMNLKGSKVNLKGLFKNLKK